MKDYDQNRHEYYNHSPKNFKSVFVHLRKNKESAIDERFYPRIIRPIIVNSIIYNAIGIDKVKYDYVLNSLPIQLKTKPIIKRENTTSALIKPTDDTSAPSIFYAYFSLIGDIDYIGNEYEFVNKLYQQSRKKVFHLPNAANIDEVNEFILNEWKYPYSIKLFNMDEKVLDFQTNNIEQYEEFIVILAFGTVYLPYVEIITDSNGHQLLKKIFTKEDFNEKVRITDINIIQQESSM